MLVEALQSYLAGNTSMRAMLGTPATRSDTTTGIFPVMAPSEVPMPYLVMEQVTGDGPADTLAGANAFQVNRWRFSCYGSTYRQAKLLAKAAKSALNDMRGDQSGSAFVQSTMLALEADDSEPFARGRGTIFGSHIDFDFSFMDGE
ncbi:MAG: hypothetical protein ACRD20_19505 [Terriglobales bacterium]